MTQQKSRGQGKGRPRKRATDKRPVTDEVSFLLDLSLAEPLNRAAEQLAAEQAVLDRLRGFPVPEGASAEVWALQIQRAEAEVAAATARRDEAKALVDENTLTVKLQAISARRYFEILEQHPPSEEQVEKADSEAEKAGIMETMTQSQRVAMRIHFNPDTYPRALVKACDVTPLDDEELDIIFDPDGPWSLDDRSELFNKALAVCERASILKR